MRPVLKKGNPKYDAVQILWDFLKEYGEPEDNDAYWVSAAEWAANHYVDDLSMNLLLAALNTFKDEVENAREGNR